jgi:hypothetical protein
MEDTEPKIDVRELSETALGSTNPKKGVLPERFGIWVILLLVLQLALQATSERRLSSIEDAVVKEVSKVEQKLIDINSAVQSLKGDTQEIRTAVSGISNAPVLSLQTVQMRGSAYQTLPVANISWSGQ